jgi:hypothetical protein
VKKVGVDIILPTILAMDKTHIDLAGHLQMEPITMLHGLLKHGMRSKPIAMRILGYINHSSPAHFPQQKTDKTTTNSNAPNRLLPPGTVIADAPLKRLQNISWPTYILNKMHMQIDFILEHSGFLRLQTMALNGIYTTTSRYTPLCYTHLFPSSSETTRVMIVFVGITLLVSKRSSNFVASVNVQLLNLGTRRQSTVIEKQA